MLREQDSVTLLFTFTFTSFKFNRVNLTKQGRVARGVNCFIRIAFAVLRERDHVPEVASRRNSETPGSISFGEVRLATLALRRTVAEVNLESI